MQPAGQGGRPTLFRVIGQLRVLLGSWPEPVRRAPSRFVAQTSPASTTNLTERYDPRGKHAR